MTLESWLALPIGVGLAAACGLRVFLPLFVAAAAAHAGVLPLTSGFGWLATVPALIVLGVATVTEVAAYYVPWLDHALDVLAAPVATIAGVLVSASVMVEFPPPVRWALAIIAGGGAAGLLQGATTVLRAKSGLLTGGLANPVVATFELVGALALALLAVFLPLAAVAGALLMGIVAWRRRRAGAIASPAARAP
ncbi:MAG: DUF4126 domain-containing protein [Gemmatimonadaceae bacterium]|nr:DUF4126 domain-containing protein [Gemmatimonadaceae bacterium]